MKLRKTIAIGCAAAAITAGAAFSSTAMASSAPTAATAPVEKHNVRYSDADIVGLLVFAKGAAADDHPDIAKEIRDHRTAQTSEATLGEISDFTNELKAVDASFHDKVTVAVQIQDPYQAQAGLERLNDDIKKYLAAYKSSGDVTTKRALGWFYHDANVVIEINVAGAINAIGYANVAGATEVAVALVVVPSAVSYGFDMSQANKLDETNLAASVSSGL